jgi:hypothetical protein
MLSTLNRDLEWKQNIYPISKPTFSGKPGLDPYLEIMEESSSTEVFNQYFDDGISGEIQ